MQRISSRDNEKIKYARRLATDAAFRADEKCFFAEGKKLCYDLAQTTAARAVYFTQEVLKAEPDVARLAPQSYLINEPVHQKLAGTQSPQGLYAVFETPAYTLADVDAGRGVLVGEGLQDPANVGAVLRSAAAFGLGGVVLLVGSADPFAPKTLRAGMGAVGRIPVVQGLATEKAAAWLAGQACRVYASALVKDACPLKDVRVKTPFALLVGSEGKGLSAQALALADEVVYIPMHHGVQSLNAAVAASVLMYHFTRG